MGVGGFVVGSMLSLIAQQDAATKQRNYQIKKNEQITEATIENYKELDKAEQDVMYNSAQDSLAAQIGALEASAQQAAYTGATGVAGGSVDNKRGQLYNQFSEQMNDINMSKRQQLSNINSQAKGILNQAKGSYDLTPIQKPSVLKAASDGYSVSSMFKTGGDAAKKAYGESRPAGRQSNMWNPFS